MSRGGRTKEGENLGGIGKGFYQKYQGDFYPSDFVIVRGKKMRPPKYYDSLYEDIESVKATRKNSARKHKEDNTPARLRIRETIKLAAITQLRRGL